MNNEIFFKAITVEVPIIWFGLLIQYQNVQKTQEKLSCCVFEGSYMRRVCGIICRTCSGSKGTQFLMLLATEVRMAGSNDNKSSKACSASP